MGIFFAKHKAANTILGLALITITFTTLAKDYHVGPKQPLATIGEVPWDSLEAGDNVFIHWRQQPYAEKWVINRQGTELNPITVSGVAGPNGKRPVIDGRNAVTVPGLNYWNDERGVINISGSTNPTDGMPAHIIIEGLEIRSAHPNYSFTDDGGKEGSNKVIKNYLKNAASIYVEKATDLIIRDCVLHDSGNGLFIGGFEGETKNILIEKNHIYGNGIAGSAYEHNAYTSAIGITYQYNQFGPLRNGAHGNNLKDRSAGLTVRYNWIEGGNRLLDMVDATENPAIINHPSYRKTYVYGNILLKKSSPNYQVMHYGGDSPDIADYRKGTLYFYNNTLYSTRGKTTLINLSTNDVSADVRNNILYVTNSGDQLALLHKTGKLTLSNNWIKPSWVKSHEGLISGSVIDDGSSIEGSDPGFIDDSGIDLNLRLSDTSAVRDMATTLSLAVLPEHDVTMEYQPHQRSRIRPTAGALDIGAYEWRAESAYNTPPKATNDTASTDENSSVTIDVLINDSDADQGDTLTIDSITQGANGTVVNNLTNITYTPNNNFNGNDSFSYAITDGNGGFSEKATVTVAVTPLSTEATSVSNHVSAPITTPEPSTNSENGGGGSINLLLLLALIFSWVFS